MSSFYMTVRNKETGKIYQVLALDDHFGHRQYGYSVVGAACQIRNEEEFFKLFERVEISQGDKP